MDRYQSMQQPYPARPGRQGEFTAPPNEDFSTPEMMGSVQKVLGNNVGQYVVIEFLIGTENIVRKQGILYHVGTSYVVLFDDVVGNYIVCDLYSIKFTYFYYPGDRPNQNYNTLYRANEGN